MTTSPPFSLRFRKLWIVLLLLGLTWMWWAALGKKSTPVSSIAVAQRAVGAAATDVNKTELIALPSKIERETLEASSRDPFALFTLPAPKLPMLKKAPSMPVIVAAPSMPIAMPAPSPPPLNLRFLGQATTPDGERMIYAALGDTPVLLTKGANLPNGYQVTSIEPKLVNLIYPPLNFSAYLALPEPPRYEIR